MPVRIFFYALEVSEQDIVAASGTIYHLVPNEIFQVESMDDIVFFRGKPELVSELGCREGLVVC
jgi:hypothetical protein